jgi:hypothetical protein
MNPDVMGMVLISISFPSVGTIISVIKVFPRVERSMFPKHEKNTTTVELSLL